MKIRVLSDVHIDVNEKCPLRLPKDDIFTVVAGDIAGKPALASQWLQENIKQGIFIRGNHDGVYVTKAEDCVPVNMPLFENKFTLKDDISYLDCSYKIVNDIVFIGATLYTDYTYGLGGVIERNMHMASIGLNDFNLGYFIDFADNVKVEPLDPKHYLRIHKWHKLFLMRTLKKFKDKKCVVVTHHSPSPQSIAGKYVDSTLNASYVNNFDNCILKFPNIKLWVHGHIHSNADYTIGKTRIINNPYGYRVTREINLNFNKNLIVEI